MGFKTIDQQKCITHCFFAGSNEVIEAYSYSLKLVINTIVFEADKRICLK